MMDIEALIMNLMIVEDAKEVDVYGQDSSMIIEHYVEVAVEMDIRTEEMVGEVAGDILEHN